MTAPLKSYNVKYWLPLLAVVLIFLITSIHSFDVYKTHQQELQSNSFSFANNLLTDLTLLLNYTIANNSLSEAQSIITKTTLNDGVDYVLVMDGHGEVLFASHLAWIGQPIEKFLSADIVDKAKSLHALQATFSEFSNIDITLGRHLAPSNDYAELALVIHYDFSHNLTNIKQHTLHHFLPILSINLLAGLIFLYAINNMLIKPLRLVKDLARQIQETDDEIHSPISGSRSNELVEVSEALTQAGRKIREDIKLLSDRENRLNITLDAIGDGVIVTDALGSITRLNPKAEEMTEWNESEALQQNITDIYRTSSHTTEVGINPVTEVLKTKQPVTLHNHTILKSKNGNKLQIYQTAAPIFEKDGVLIGVVLVFQNVSNEYQLREQLKTNIDFLKNLLQISPSITCVLKPSSQLETRYKVEYISESINRYHIGNHESLSYVELINHIHAEDLSHLEQTLNQASNTPGEVFSCSYRLRQKDNSFASFDANFVGILEHGRLTQIVIVAIDVTKQKRAELEKVFWGSIMEESLHEIYVLDSTSFKFLRVNHGAQENTGYTEAELQNLTPIILDRSLNEESLENLLAPLVSGQEAKLEFETLITRKDETRYPVEVHCQLNKSYETPVIIAMVNDITERKQADSRLDFLAYHDILTELPNRLLLDDRLAQTINYSRRNNKSFALLFLDLDRFKYINDSLGHAVGDNLLIKVAQRLRSNLRSEDTIARTGGDEFTIILPDTDNKGAANVCTQLTSAIAEPYHISNHHLHINVSIGISMFPDNGTTAMLLQQKADNAMYRAKASDKTRYQFFTDEMHEQMIKRMQIEGQLHTALAREEFSLVYQPQLNIQTNKIVGAEALIRWNNPTLGFVPPLDFIPIAEEIGLINQIGHWVLEQASKQASYWTKNIITDPFVMAVNLSAMQFNDDRLLDEVKELLSLCDLPTSALELEVTESMAMQNLGHTIEQMGKFKEAEINLSMDDFGTGFSSLSSLKEFPLNTLKIDKSFIDEMLTDKEDEAIVQTIITLATTLNLEIIAEGVETKQQLDSLKQKGCKIIQGYYFSRPLPPADFEQLLKSELTL